MVGPTARAASQRRTPGRTRVGCAPWEGSTRWGVWAVLPLLLGASLLASACEPSDPARAGAERFIDRYYVEINLPEAKKHATGFATAKLDREMELLEGIDAPESSGKPHVNYRFLEERAGSDAEHRGFLYELTITFGGGAEVVRRALVTVRGSNQDWRVANFQELD